jgi:hypothetical protein
LAPQIFSPKIGHRFFERKNDLPKIEKWIRKPGKISANKLFFGLCSWKAPDPEKHTKIFKPKYWVKFFRPKTTIKFFRPKIEKQEITPAL